jgi:hypothetical protein
MSQTKRNPPLHDCENLKTTFQKDVTVASASWETLASKIRSYSVRSRNNIHQLHVQGNISTSSTHDVIHRHMNTQSKQCIFSDLDITNGDAQLHAS